MASTKTIDNMTKDRGNFLVVNWYPREKLLENSDTLTVSVIDLRGRVFRGPKREFGPQKGASLDVEMDYRTDEKVLRIQLPNLNHVNLRHTLMPHFNCFRYS